ncbi:MAG: hypothetical protein JXB36_04940 [Gammaproteobacteria bacterium]|nr:hypothetical protein [Gammaproteobacteria bacterium]
MSVLEKYSLRLTFALSFLVVGVPYWLIPYDSVNVPNALYGPGLFVVGLSAFALRLHRTATLRKVVLVIGGAVPAAVFARVAVEGVIDPTSHNLWPLEVVIALFVGFAVALPAAVVGNLLGAVWISDRAHRER